MTRRPAASRLSRMAHRSIDPGGRPIVRVPLAHTKVTSKNPRRFALLDAEDFDRLMAAGVSPCWTLNRDGKMGIGYVRAPWGSDPRGRTLVSIAPLVLGTEPGQRVHYRDGNRLNLRRSNLWAA